MFKCAQVRSTVIGDGQAGAQLACACWHGAHSIHRRRGSLPCLAERAHTRPRGAQHRPATAAGLVVSRQSPSLFKGRARHQALAQGDCQQEVRIIVAVAGSSDRVAHVRRGCPGSRARARTLQLLNLCPLFHEKVAPTTLKGGARQDAAATARHNRAAVHRRCLLAFGLPSAFH